MGVQSHWRSSASLPVEGEVRSWKGKCLVHCPTACHVKSVDGLEILDLEIVSKAFRTRWAWNLRASDKRPWYELVSPDDEEIRALSNAATMVVLHNGERTMFWTVDGLTARQ